MKRILVSLFVTPSFPLTVLFALTAGPSRLYAESSSGDGGRTPTCATPDIEACFAKSSNATCAFDGGVGTCRPSRYCIDDGGVAQNALVCYLNAPLVEAGPVEASGDGNTDDGTAMSSDVGANADVSQEASAYADAIVWDREAASSVVPDGAARDGDSSTTTADGGRAAWGSDSGTSAISPAAGGGCSAAGASPGAALGSAAALILTVGALFGIRRRARRRA